MKPARGFLAPALLVLALGTPGAARADEAPDLAAARDAFNEASALAQQKRWNAACDRYAQSLSLHRTALTLYSLAVAQREAGRLVAAQSNFQAFLAEPTTKTTQLYLEAARSGIAELKGRIGTLTVVLVPAPVPSATVTIDGAVVSGAAIARSPVDPGPHDLVARAPGRAEARAHLTVAEGGSATVTLNLTPLPAGAATEEPTASVPTASVPTTSDPRSAPWPRPVPFALLGGGAAVLAAGLTVGLVGVADAEHAPSPMGPEADGARSKAIAGDVLAGFGIAAAGAGLVLLLVQQHSPAFAAAWPRLHGGSGVSVSF